MKIEIPTDYSDISEDEINDKDLYHARRAGAALVKVAELALDTWTKEQFLTACKAAFEAEDSIGVPLSMSDFE
jgi:hypothetical protein